MCQLTGIIMAGGKSSRMGTDKGLLPFKGKPMAQYAIELLKPICSEVLISTQNNQYSQFGLQLLPDLIPDCGPIGGIYTALKKSQNKYILTLACDMPLMTLATLQTLIANFDGYDCVVPSMNGRLEPICAIYSITLLNKVEDNIRKRKFAIHNLIMESHHLLIDFDEDLPDFKNMNFINDLDGH